MESVNKKPLMASSTTQSSSMQSSATLLAGSEELFDVFCRPCSKENLYLEAIKYCKNCKQYLCNTCFKSHLEAAPTRHHKLMDKVDMMKNKVAASPTYNLKETCPKHKHKLLEYFCTPHNDLCCSICFNLDHVSCRFISHIPDVSDGIASSDDYKSLMTDMQALVASLKKQHILIIARFKDNDKYKTESLAGIIAFRKEVNKLIEKYEEDSVMKLIKLHQSNSEKIEAMSSKCRMAISAVTALIAQLDSKAKCDKQNQLFVDINLSRQRLVDMKAEACDVKDRSITRYFFHEDEKINEMISTLSAAWSLSIRHYGGETKARYLGEVNVNGCEDALECSINGIVALPGGDLAMTDFNNKSLKKVDMKLNKLSSRLSLSSIPSGLTKTKANEVAVSLGSEQKIEIYTVSDVLSCRNTVHVADMDICYGICCAEDRFILAYPDKGLIKIVEMSGRVLSTISTDTNGDHLFNTPRYIAIGRDNSIIYVTDEKAHTVTTMTLSGHVISVYRNDKLKNPRGVTVGPDHKVYVGSRDTMTVLQLSATGEFQQVLLDKQCKLSTNTECIAYDDTRDRLYTSSLCNELDDRNYVKFFRLHTMNEQLVLETTSL